MYSLVCFQRLPYLLRQLRVCIMNNGFREWLRHNDNESLRWSMPCTVSRRSRQSPWAVPRPARLGQERRKVLYDVLFAEYASWISLYPKYRYKYSKSASWISLYPKYRYKYSKSGRTVQSSTSNPHDFVQLSSIRAFCCEVAFVQNSVV